MSQSNDIELFTIQLRGLPRRLCLLLFFAELACGALRAQDPATSKTGLHHISDIERRLNSLADELTETQKALQQSLVEIQQLRMELDAVRHQDTALPQPETDAVIAQPQPESSSSVQTELQALQEQQEILQAEIKQHDQSKVETDSKYRLKITGIALFNAFSNAGVVDNAELPTLALERVPGASHGSNGATLRQTVFGIAATGPVIAGAHSSAEINVDFFGGATTNDYGYTAAAGYVRMRDASLSLDWDKSTIEVGYTAPLISPRSPSSYATVAGPSLAGFGNLWTWSPQVRFEQRLPLREKSGISLEGGLIYPDSPNYPTIQADSPVEASRRPGVEARIAYHSDRTGTASPHSLELGVGSYTSSQFYNSATHVHSWAVTGDWQIPLTKHFDLSGEVYRGRALGGLGGGLYKDVLTGADVVTGLSRTVGVDTAGGWSQLKLNLSSRIEANASFGIDDAYASSFESVVLAASANPTYLAARNQAVVGNVILRPRASLILSPEYRHIISWGYMGAPNTANIFTLSAGYQF